MIIRKEQLPVVDAGGAGGGLDLTVGSRPPCCRPGFATVSH